MSDTPRTKAFMAELSSRCDDWSWFAQRVEDFARQLERELNQAHTDGAKLSETVIKLADALKAEKQRVFKLLGKIDHKHDEERKLLAEQNSDA